MKSLKNLLFPAHVAICKTINVVGRFMLESATAVGLLACAACMRMGIGASIHSGSDFHTFRETYWSGRNESLGGFFVCVISVAVALFIAYGRYVLLVGNDDTTAIDDTKKAAKAPTNEYKETQTCISSMYFLGFIVTSIIWAIITSSGDTHWADFMIDEVMLDCAIAVVACVISMPIGSSLSSFYSEENHSLKKGD